MSRRRDNYDIVDLIEAVEERPCLWDRRTEEYKDRNSKELAWKQICCIVDSSYENASGREQRNIETSVQKKWRNVRDAFAKSLKKHEHGSRKYLYHKNLIFLLDVLEKEDTGSNHSDTTSIMYLNEDDDWRDSDEDSKQNVSRQIKKLKKRRFSNDDGGVDDKRSLMNPLDFESPSQTVTLQSCPDEDESFFMSVLPSVRTFNQDEKLQFRLEVIQLIQRMKFKARLEQPQPSTSTE